MLFRGGFSPEVEMGIAGEREVVERIAFGKDDDVVLGCGDRLAALEETEGVGKKHAELGEMKDTAMLGSEVEKGAPGLTRSKSAG